MDKVIILIIAHKEDLTRAEKSSLSQCYKILNKYPIKLVCPKGLDVSEYKKVNTKAEFEFINPKWQSTYKMFNLLKMRSLLYKKYKDYQYILFYELDAWVFKDELEYWCNKEYDYIGAPWFSGFDECTSESTAIGAGNGGFSLRKVSAALAVLEIIDPLSELRSFWFKSYLQSLYTFEKLHRFLNKLQKNKIEFEEINQLLIANTNEDHFWALKVPTVFKEFKVASIEESVPFSFEANPSKLYLRNNNQLPFGCHAWLRYEPEFWNNFIHI